MNHFVKEKRKGEGEEYSTDEQRERERETDIIVVGKGGGEQQIRIWSLSSSLLEVASNANTIVRNKAQCLGGGKIRPKSKKIIKKKKKRIEGEKRGGEAAGNTKQVRG